MLEGEPAPELEPELAVGLVGTWGVPFGGAVVAFAAFVAFVAFVEIVVVFVVAAFVVVFVVVFVVAAAVGIGFQRR